MLSHPLQLSQSVVLSTLCTAQRCFWTHCYHPRSNNKINDTYYIRNSNNNNNNNGEGKRMIIENRASKWCLRLWGLSRRRTRQQEVESTLSYTPHLQLSKKEEISFNNDTRNEFSQGNMKSDKVDYDQMRDNALLHDLHQRIQHTVGSASNALPVLMAEAIWNVYDELVSPYTAHEMNNNDNKSSRIVSTLSFEKTKGSARISTIHTSNKTSVDSSDKVNSIHLQELQVQEKETQTHTMLEEQQNEELENGYVTNFFRFISLIVQLDMNISALQDATTQLTVEMEHYSSLLSQLHGLQLNHNNNSDGESKESKVSNCHNECIDNNKTSSDHSTEALQHALLLSKGNLTRLGFNVRTAAAPLHYLWLRHTAATENGLRRIMDFRKTVHMFDIQCKTRIKELNRALQQIQSSTTTANHTQEINEADCEGTKEHEKLQRQISKWTTRQRHIYLIDNSLGLLFNDFFSKEYLVMEELTWFNSPPMLLEQIMAAEQVHPFVNGLTDMKYRLQPAWHRHLFAFLHPAIVEEPLIAVQVALTNGFARSVDVILHRSTPLADENNHCMAAEEFQLKNGDIRENETMKNSKVSNSKGGKKENMMSSKKEMATQSHFTQNTYLYDSEDDVVDTAIFYSINSAQSSLRGMDMGNMLIKRAVKEIDEVINTSRRAMQRSLIVNFSTLSPISSYVRWLSNEVDKIYSASVNNVTVDSRKEEEEELLKQVFGQMDDYNKFEEFYLTPLREKLMCVTEELLSIHRDDQSNNEMLSKLKMHYNALNTLLEENNKIDKSKICETTAQQLQHSNKSFEIHFHTLKMLVYLFRSVQDSDRYKWWWNHSFTRVLEKPLLKSVAHYLLEVKKYKTNMSTSSTTSAKESKKNTLKRTTRDNSNINIKNSDTTSISEKKETINIKNDDDNEQKQSNSNKENVHARMYDPVGNFHITNGATILQINYLANTTAQGSRESGCVMVNYWYNMNTVADNVRQYELEYTVAATEQMRRTLDICENF